MVFFVFIGLFVVKVILMFFSRCPCCRGSWEGVGIATVWSDMPALIAIGLVVITLTTVSFQKRLA